MIDGYTVREHPLGVFLTADDGCGQTLVVGVHGLNSSPAMWKPEFLTRWLRLDRADLDTRPDVFLFSYASRPGLRGGSRQAAKDLGRALRFCKSEREVEYAHEHIVILAHSNGGRVVKQLMTSEARLAVERCAPPDEVAATGPRRHDITPLGRSDALSLRTRRIVSIGTPHAGAHWLATILLSILGIFLQAAVYPILLLLRFTIGLAGGWASRLGWNSIPWELMPFQGSHKRDEAAWQAVRAECARHDLPCPEDVDLVGTDDATRNGLRSLRDAQRKTGDQGFYEAGTDERVRLTSREMVWLRGGHILSQIDAAELSPTVQAAIDVLRCRARRTVAERSVAYNHLFELERVIPVYQMLGEVGTPHPDTAAGILHIGQQRQLLHEMHEYFVQEVPGSRQYVVTGGAGVGKSRMLARLARRLALRHLTAGPSAPLPLYFDLKALPIQIPARPGPDAGEAEQATYAAQISQAIIVAWCKFAGAAARGRAEFVPGTIRGTIMAHGPTVAILDGVDDFLVRAQVPWRTFKDEVLGRLQQVVKGEDHPVYVVLGCRDGTPGLAELRSPAWVTFRLQRVDEAFARQRYPTLPDLLEKLREAPNVSEVARREIEEILMTPLVLEAISVRARAILGFEASVPSVLRLAMEGILFPLEDPPQEGALETNICALAVLARCFYESGEAQLGKVQIGQYIHALRAEWSTDNPDSTMESAFALLDSPEEFARLLTTVFESRGTETWNFAHRMWADFLTARFYAQCARAQNLEAIGSVTYQPLITSLAGQELAQWPLPAALVSAAQQRSVETGNTLYISNLFALGSWNPQAQFSGEAVTALLACVDDDRLPQFPRCLIASGLTVRLLAARLGVAAMAAAEKAAAKAQEAGEAVTPKLQGDAGAGIDITFVSHEDAIVDSLTQSLQRRAGWSPLAFFASLSLPSLAGSEVDSDADRFVRFSQGPDFERDGFGKLTERQCTTLEQAIAVLVGKINLDTYPIRAPSSLMYLVFLALYQEHRTLSPDNYMMSLNVLSPPSVWRDHWTGVAERAAARENTPAADVMSAVVAELDSVFKRRGATS